MEQALWGLELTPESGDLTGEWNWGLVGISLVGTRPRQTGSTIVRESVPAHGNAEGTFDLHP